MQEVLTRGARRIGILAMQEIQETSEIREINESDPILEAMVYHLQQSLGV